MGGLNQYLVHFDMDDDYHFAADSNTSLWHVDSWYLNNDDDHSVRCGSITGLQILMLGGAVMLVLRWKDTEMQPSASTIERLEALAEPGPEGGVK